MTAPTQKPMLEAHSLTKRFGHFTAVRDVSLRLYGGAIHALIGPNGAGKTTLLNLLSGVYRPEHGGVVWLAGRRVTGKTPAYRARLGMGRSFQRALLFSHMTASDNLLLALRGREFARAPSLRAFSSGGAEARAEADAALGEVGLETRARVPVRALSHGERRGVELAMAFAGGSQVVLLDEPLAGLGAGESRAMVDTIRRLRGARAVLMIEHDLDAVFRLADRITVLVSGSVIASGTPREIVSDKKVRAAYLPHGTAQAEMESGDAEAGPT